MSETSADEAKLMFSFAHDLRAFLRTMYTRTQLVQRSSEQQLSEQQARWLEEALAAGDDMGKLIGSIVTYYSVSEVKETMTLGLLLRSLRLDTKQTLLDAGGDLTIAGGDSQAIVSRCLAPVLRELIANSCRFRRPDLDLKIQISAGPSEDHNQEIVITDNGKGVAVEYHEAIFEPFRRMHGRSEYPGFGLGLAICRKTLSVNGGSIQASPSADGGMTMKVLIPAA